MSNRVAQCAEHLARLIAFRSENPGGDEPTLCAQLAQTLTSCGAEQITVTEVPRAGQTGAYVYARWGTPETIVNVHIDTVPANSGWSRDPWDAQVTEDRVVGLGAADTKGAIAALLTVLQHTKPRNFGVLFSGDEERSSTCMSAFIAAGHTSDVRRAIVCEPTARTAGIRHRGVRAYQTTYQGAGGHSSRADHMPKPIVTLARLALQLDALAVASMDQGPEGMTGLCMNVASLDGGVAFNVVPDNATLKWSVRPPPGLDVDAFDASLERMVKGVDESMTLTGRIAHPAFSCDSPEQLLDLIGPSYTKTVGLDFWTEAALLAQAGVDAVVLGPGDIAQAHAADEYVTLDDLTWAMDIFRRVVGAS